MKINQSVFAVTVAFILIAQSGKSEANRLRVFFDLPPSSALFSPSRDLTVLHEDLQFDCDAAGCQVSATYRIRSKQQAALNMSFISPSNRVDMVSVNGTDTKPNEVVVAKFTDYRKLYNTANEAAKSLGDLVEQSERNIDKNSSAKANPEHLKLLEKYRVASAERDRLERLIERNKEYYIELFGKLTKLHNTPSEECTAPPDLARPNGWEHYVACLAMNNSPTSSSLFGSNQNWEMYRFNFDAAILPGENTVKLRYRQPYSYAETDVGLFSTPPLNHASYVSYELWPLKEWNLDAEFKMDISVRIHNPRYGFMYREQGGLSVSGLNYSEKVFSNVGLLGVAHILPPDTLETLRDDYLVYKKALKKDFHDRLFIEIHGQVR